MRSTAIESVHRDEAGKMHLALRGRSERITVSRLYAQLFRAMQESGTIPSVCAGRAPGRSPR